MSNARNLDLAVTRPAKTVLAYRSHAKRVTRAGTGGRDRPEEGGKVVVNGLRSFAVACSPRHDLLQGGGREAEPLLSTRRSRSSGRREEAEAERSKRSRTTKNAGLSAQLD